VLNTEVFDLPVPCDFGRVQAHDPDQMDTAVSIDLVCVDMLVNNKVKPEGQGFRTSDRYWAAGASMSHRCMALQPWFVPHNGIGSFWMLGDFVEREWPCHEFLCDYRCICVETVVFDRRVKYSSRLDSPAWHT
jgi:hypothetical protein